MSSDRRSRRPGVPRLVIQNAGLCLLLLGPALLLTGCGKKGAPEPPLRTSPQTTSQLTVAQRGDELLLGLPYPATTSAGQALAGIQEVVVYEMTVPVPASERDLLVPQEGDAAALAAAASGDAGERTEADEPLEPASTDFYAELGIRTADEVDAMEAQREVAEELAEASAEGDPESEASADGDEDAAEEAAEEAYVPPSRESRLRQLLEPLDARQFEAGAKVLARVSGDDLSSAVTGGQVQLSVPLTQLSADEPALHYVAVRTIGPSLEPSDLSNQAVLLPLPSPPSPRGLKTEAMADGIRVEWSPQGEVVGYNLYRRNARSRVFDVPVAVPTAERTDYLDRTAVYGQTYLYAVTAVSRRSPLVESAVTQVQEVLYRDTFAPPTPQNVVALAEEGRVRVVWRGSEAEDLAGYGISRRTGTDGPFIDLTAGPQTGAEYSDTDVTAGVSYTYRVVAVDEAGNASTAAEANTEAR